MTQPAGRLPAVGQPEVTMGAPDTSNPTSGICPVCCEATCSACEECSCCDGHGTTDDGKPCPRGRGKRSATGHPFRP